MSRAKRKLDHLRGALNSGQSRRSGFDDISFVHQSIPDTNVKNVQLNSTIGELNISSPIFINAMTGGGGQATEKVNASLAEAASVLGTPIAVGSQMAAINNESERSTYEVVRDKNPQGIVFANIGSEAEVHQALRCVEMIDADALQIHLNVIQELVMPEGDRNFQGALQRIEAICDALDVPVIVKEVGFGMSMETAKKLHSSGVSIIDIGGFGGTNFSSIENKRRENELSFFDDWGIATTNAVVEANVACPNLEVLATGGVQSALDIAKSLALGASACGMAGQVLKWVQTGGPEEVVKQIHHIQYELTWIMAALGIHQTIQFKKVPIILKGDTHHWLQERGVNTSLFSNRSLER
ncbi:type 2 isopentenyl-diphosphate Delta-isomerase [Alteribacter populi]|uniref:type 2 isopentenyl-diphosphate Delta-isomerase n=1 Tax=Alteribacter populi TaxID=2011011 RepID=UPI000BBB4EC9|nr:type 2 isopentenyl-diphosphate Delta-isomerase [Alteribacter populi]